MANGGTSKRSRVISFKLPSLREQQRRRNRSASWHAGSLGSETVVRSFNFLRYCVICSVSLFNAMAPWALAVVEATLMSLLYFLMVPDAVLVRKPWFALHYSFKHSLEDVLLFSLARDLAVILAYACGAGAKYHRPYMWTAYTLAAIGTPFCLAKLFLFHYSRNPLSAVFVLVANMGFTAMHVIAAQNVVRWARKRYDMGLGGFGYPAEDSEESWLVMDSRSPHGWSDDTESAVRSTDDVPPAALADPDSRFVECRGLTVHYKEACVPTAMGSETGIVLMHGYGGGAFSWRHVLGPLARSTGCRVIAFDRPAFGLTSRPRPPLSTSQLDNPYSMRYQTGLTLALCSRLGLRRVLFVGHADGALLALLTTAMAADLRSKQAGGRHHGGLMRPAAGYAAWQSPLQQTAAQLLYRSQSEPSGRISMGASLTNRRLPMLMAGKGVMAVPRQQHGSPPLSEPESCPSEPSTPDSRSRESSSSQLTVVIVAPHQPSPGTVSEDDPQSNAEMGLLSPMLSPRATSSASGDKGSAYFLVADVVSELCGVRSQTTDSASVSDLAGLLPFQPPGDDPEVALGHADANVGEASDDILQELRSGLEAGSEGGPALEPLGLALLHPNLAGEAGPSFTRILGKSRLGRKILRPLLRSEIGVVSARRAWHDASKLTQDVLDTYQRPLRVQNWDTALAEVSRLKREISPEQLQTLYSACAGLPALVATGAQDGIVPRAQAGAVAADLGAARTPESGAVHMACIPHCGHLSHEEAPDALLQHLTAFADQAMYPHQQQQIQLAYSGG